MVAHGEETQRDPSLAKTLHGYVLGFFLPSVRHNAEEFPTQLASTGLGACELSVRFLTTLFAESGYYFDLQA